MRIRVKCAVLDLLTVVGVLIVCSIAVSRVGFVDWSMVAAFMAAGWVESWESTGSIK